MDTYFAIKTLHIVSSTILFGTGLGIAFFFFMANRSKDPGAMLFAARTTVLADFIFTLPAVIIQPLTGFWLAHNMGYGLAEHWLLATYGLYALAGLCWIPVVIIQMRLRDILQQYNASKKTLPKRYYTLCRTWFALGWPAFLSLIAIFLLMVFKPTW